MSTDWREKEKALKEALDTARLMEDANKWFTLEQVQITISGTTYTYRYKGATK